MRKTRMNNKKNKTKKRKIRGGNGELCPICQEELSFKDNFFTHQTCKNTFHTDCIKEWCSKLEDEERDCTCPMCRENIIPIPYGDLDIMYDECEEYKNSLKLDRDNIIKSLETGDILKFMNKEYSELANRYNDLVNKFNTLGGYSRGNANYVKQIRQSLGRVAVFKNILDY